MSHLPEGRRRDWDEVGLEIQILMGHSEKPFLGGAFSFGGRENVRPSKIENIRGTLGTWPLRLVLSALSLFRSLEIMSRRGLVGVAECTRGEGGRGE